MTKVINFPIWKENCTAIEKLREVLQYAESKPEEVQHVLIIYEDSKCIRQACCDQALTVTQALGMLDLAKYDLMRNM
jgi:Na+/H+ antiporter NhaB